MDTLLVMDHKRKLTKQFPDDFNVEEWVRQFAYKRMIENFNKLPNLVTGDGYVRNKDLELQVLGDKITRDPKISWRFSGSIFLGIYWRPDNIDLLHAVYNDLIMTERGGIHG